MKPIFFPTAAAFRAWLKKHHKSANELWVGYYRKETGKPTMTWSESVDEALCFGWIDGVRKKISDEAYTNRFTPRRPGSIIIGDDLSNGRQNFVHGGFFGCRLVHQCLLLMRPTGKGIRSYPALIRKKQLSPMRRN